ncbi:MAG: hypothetical protein Q8R00_02020 [Candidatus Nanoarchaeia archaeon]|nr:hypothetical protein [Candidatus Nanoarchaeia archaeon]
MGLLNRLFGKKEEGEKVVLKDLNEAKKIWEAYVVSFTIKQDALAGIERDEKGKIELKRLKDKELKEMQIEIDLIKDPVKIREKYHELFIKEHLKILNLMESLISEELVNIKGEIKTQNEIIKDLERLSSKKEVDKIGWLTEEGEAWVNDLMEKLYEILITELHAIKMMKGNPELIVNDFNWGSFRRLVNDAEARILIKFSTWLEGGEKKQIQKIMHKIFSGKPLKPRRPEAKEPEGGISIEMENTISGIINDVLETYDNGLVFLGKVIYNDSRLAKLINEFSPGGSKEEVKKIMEAMRYIYETEGFVDLNLKKAKEEE